MKVFPLFKKKEKKICIHMNNQKRRVVLIPIPVPENASYTAENAVIGIGEYHLIY